MRLDTQATAHIALRGALETVERCRPVLLVKFWPLGIRERGESPIDVLTWYSGLGYGRRVLEDPSFDAASHEALIAAVHARPAPFGGSVTLRLDPLE